MSSQSESPHITCAGAGKERMEWLYHKKPLFLMHWKDGKVPQSVQDKVVVIPGGNAPVLQLQAYRSPSQCSAISRPDQTMHQHARA